MALTNQQFDDIMRGYNFRQLENRKEHERRKDQIYAEVPAYKDLDEQMSSYARQMIIDSMSSGSGDFSSGKAYIAQLSEKKTQALIDAGYPADYLAPIYTCKDCKDTGFVEEGAKKCHCFLKEEIATIYKQSNIQQLLADENFSTFRFDVFEDAPDRNPEHPSALDLAKKAHEYSKNFVKYFDERFDNILFMGNTGCGKTFLTNCIAKELLDSTHSVIYLTAYDFFATCEKETFAHDEEASQYNSTLLDCDLLIIDDLGTEFTNSFTASRLFSYINERIVRRKSTIISTNLNLPQLVETYSERVTSRLFSNYEILKLSSKDIRMRKFI